MQQFIEKAKNIRLLILDVDGVLTSGLIYYSATGEELKAFHTHDGLGMRVLQQCGIPIAVISGRKSSAVAKRLAELGINHVYLGYENKLPIFNEILSSLNLKKEQVAYMGDDLPDLPLLLQAGLAFTVPNAPVSIQKHAHVITKNQGGHGAVREACEFILQAQDQFEPMIQSYLNSTY